MPINITMPALSPTMEEGILAKWLVKEGDSVSAGDIIAEIETDKATMEVEAVDEGVIGKILVAGGTEGVKVNAVIAVLLEEGESASDIGKVSDISAAPPPQPSPSGGEGVAPANVTPAKEQTAPAPIAAPAANTGERIFASPLARRIAKDANIDISAISGSGPKGRVIKVDVEKAKAEGVLAKTPASKATMASGMSSEAVKALYEAGTYEERKNDGMRTVVAARLTEAKQTIPHFYLNIECNLDNLLKARAEINGSAPKDKEGKPEFKLSVNDFIVKAWALALQKVPDGNATWAGDSILYHKASDVAVAVAVEGGLFTPVVRSAEKMTLRQISDAVRDYAMRAKSKKLAPHEYQGGSTAISNLGMFGIKQFSAVINPPHGTILAVGAGSERVYADKGEMKIGVIMDVTLSCDHRSVDGALGALMLDAFKKMIENPVMMLA
ncbi:MAG: pyruvate dehydrogenase complex dihydrolipoamide acetyltransferase [Devosiaceae bacterium]|nr:pyruvate dehydrogenase complex dihydrolipoamide acetyltransferase [Devosiaceae bacterium]